MRLQDELAGTENRIAVGAAALQRADAGVQHPATPVPVERDRGACSASRNTPTSRRPRRRSRCRRWTSADADVARGGSPREGRPAGRGTRPGRRRVCRTRAVVHGRIPRARVRRHVDCPRGALAVALAAGPGRAAADRGGHRAGLGDGLVDAWTRPRADHNRRRRHPAVVGIAGPGPSPSSTSSRTGGRAHRPLGAVCAGRLAGHRHPDPVGASGRIRTAGRAGCRRLPRPSLAAPWLVVVAAFLGVRKRGGAAHRHPALPGRKRAPLSRGGAEPLA